MPLLFSAQRKSVTVEMLPVMKPLPEILTHGEGLRPFQFADFII